MDDNFDNIRCYNDEETVEALGRIVKHEEFFPIFRHVFPELNKAELTELFLSLTGLFDFQARVVHRTVNTVVAKSMDGFFYEGIENVSKEKASMFVANHRDIVLDAALLQIVLKSNEIRTSQITFGSNLMTSQFIIDLGKSNKMFTVFRDSDRRKQLTHSKELSSYMRHVIKNKNESIWIAQRSGRTKNGIDETSKGLLRMFTMSGKGNMKERLKELNIIPLIISYEFEPCDYLKAYETCIAQKREYVKKPGEDFNSIVQGIGGYKGRTKLVFGNSISDFIDTLPETISKKDIFQVVASEIDRQVYKNYQLWPNNYIAFDLLNDGGKYANEYSDTEKNRFLEHLNAKINQVDLNKEEFRIAFLNIYANPVLMSQKVVS